MTAISCIVPTYDRAGLLVEALKSVLSQTRPVAEIVVWDDGSTDGTEAAVAGLAQEARARQEPAIRYFRDANGGKSRALNRAMAEIRGDAVWICDDDDICRPDAAEHMAEAMETTGAPVVGGRYRRFGTDPATGAPVDADPGYWPDLAEGSILRHLLEDVFLFQNATLATRAAYDRVGPFREDLARAIDYDMIVRLAARHPIGFIDAVLFEQRKHAGARGPAAARHDATQMDAVWGAADRDVFRGFRGALPLSLYEAMFEAEDPRVLARAARLQRGTVYARKGLWIDACADFEAAVAEAPHTPLAPVEAEICRRAFAGKHGCDGALADDVRARLPMRAAPAGPAGPAVASAFALGLRWRVRQAATARAPRRAARLAGLALRLALRAGRAAARPTDAVTVPVAERRNLPVEAYGW